MAAGRFSGVGDGVMVGDGIGVRFGAGFDEVVVVAGVDEFDEASKVGRHDMGGGTGGGGGVVVVVVLVPDQGGARGVETTRFSCLTRLSFPRGSACCTGSRLHKTPFL